MANFGRGYNARNGNGLDMDCSMAREVKLKWSQELFESLYAAYPRKQGKSPAQRVLRGQIRTQTDVEQFNQAVFNYKAHLKRSSTEAQFVMYFDTFCRQWKDWLDSGHGSVALEKDKIDLSDVGFER